MSYLTHGRKCTSCFHLHHRCMESQGKDCDKFVARSAGMTSTIKDLESAKWRTKAMLVALLGMMAVAVVLARL